MQKGLRKSLIHAALLSSPIIALYGVSPIYIFKKLPLEYFFYTWIGLTINNLIFWLINIVLIHKLGLARKSLLYTLSFLFTLLFQLPKLLFKDLLPFHVLLDELMLYPFLSTFAINTIILIICNSLVLGHQKKEAEQTLQQLHLEHLEAQKQVLMQQLQPHFLFNALSVLKSLVTEDAQKAENYTIQLSNFLRYSVSSNQRELVRLADELQFVNDFIRLQKMRFEGAFEFNASIEEESDEKQIPVLALQTLVENAFKHNYFTEKNPLLINIATQGDHLKVSNNKVSIKITERSGTGLLNLQKRYELIMGKGITIDETEQQFTVMIPLLPA